MSILLALLGAPSPFLNRWSAPYAIQADAPLWTGASARIPLALLQQPLVNPRLRIDLQPDPYWLGIPQGIDALVLTRLLQVPFAPSFPQFYIPDTGWYWGPNSWGPQGSGTIPLLTAGGKPFYQQWRYDYESGATGWWWGPNSWGPQPTLLPWQLAKPFSKQWRDDLEPDKFWQGQPVANLTPQKVTKPFTIQWRYDYTPEPERWGWGPMWGPLGSNTLDMLAGQPFSNEWASQYTYDSSATGWYWGPGMWGPLPSAPLYIPKPKPFYQQWRYDYEPDKYWLGTPTFNIVPQQSAVPFFKQWRYDYHIEQPIWVGNPTFNEVPEELAKPFFNRWAAQYTFEPDKFWQGQPTFTPVPRQLAVPFSKLWRWDHVPDPVWTWAAPSSDTLAVLVEGGEPFSNEWYAQCTYVPPTDWLGTPRQAFTLTTPGPEPFSNEWNSQYTYEPDKFWLGAPTANLTPQQLAQPFSKQWRYDYATDWIGWVGTPTFNEVPEELARPFHQQWRYDYHIEQPVWTWQAPAAVRNYLGGQVPTKQWRYDLITDTWWQGAPISNLQLGALSLQQPPTAIEWPQYNLEPDKLWTGAPQPAPAVSQIVVKPFYQQWRYDYEPDKFWLGTPVYNAVPEELARPFSKQWRYDWNTEYPQWQGTSTSNQVPQEFAQPFSKQWEYNWDSGQTVWTWQAPSSATLAMLVEGGAPFFKLWRYDLVPDPYWQGQPEPTNLRTFPFVEPFSKQWRYDYEPDKYWTGTPLVAYSINTPVTEPFFKLWRYDYDTGATQWTWQPPGSATLDQLVEGGTPFHFQWEYNLEPDKYWQGKPLASETILTPTPFPFSNEWFSQFTFEPDKYWQGTPYFNAIPEEFAQPFSKQWEYNLVPDPFWQGAPIFAATAQDLIVGGKPFAKLWRWDYDVEYPNKWQGTPEAAASIYLTPTEPPHVQWSAQYAYDAGATYWQGAPRAPFTARVPIFEPFHFQWEYNYDSDVRLWQRYSTPAISLFDLVSGGRPFHIQWRYDYHLEAPYWQGSPRGTNEQTIPIVVPFSKQWTSQYAYNSGETYWQRYSMPAITQNILVEGGRPFHTQWRYDFEPDKYWQGSPVQTNVRTIPFVVPFSNEWAALYTWDSGQSYWQGRPAQTNIRTLPPPKPVVNIWAAEYTYESGATVWVGTPQAVPGAIKTPAISPIGQAALAIYFKNYIPVETRWQGVPTAFPPYRINVSVAVWDPSDTLPGRPIHPRRKDPLVWMGDDLRKNPIPDDPLHPRRKDPLVFTGDDWRRDPIPDDPLHPRRKDPLKGRN